MNKAANGHKRIRCLISVVMAFAMVIALIPSGIRVAHAGGAQVSFNANGGGGTMNPTGASGSFTLPGCEFTAPQGMKFAGWSDKVDDKEEYYIVDSTISVPDNITLYAVWINEDTQVIQCAGDNFEYDFFNNGTYTLNKAAQEPFTDLSIAQFYNVTDNMISISPSKTGLKDLVAHKLGATFTLKDLPTIEYNLAGNSYAVGLKVKYVATEKALNFEVIYDSVKTLTAGDTDFLYQFYNDGTYTSDLAGDPSGRIDSEAVVKFYNDTADDVAFKPDSFDPIKSDKYGRAINVKELPGIEKLIDAGSTASIGVEVAYSKEKMLITVETINPENKILRFKDADFRYQFYNDGRYTSNVSGDTSGSISGTGYVKFFSNWDQKVNFVPEDLGSVPPYTYGRKTGVAKLPYYENMLGNPNAVGLEVIYSHTEKTVTIQPLAGEMVSFDANGGEGTMNPMGASGTFTLPECGFTAPQGKKFAGWSDKADDKEKYYIVDPTISVKDSITLYAVWIDAGTQVIQCAGTNFEYDFFNNGSYTLNGEAQVPFTESSNAQFYNVTDSVISISPSGTGLTDLVAHKLGAKFTLANLPTIEYYLAGNSYAVGLKVKYVAAEKALSFEVIYDSKTLTAGDTDFLYQFYNDGTYTSDLAGDPSGRIDSEAVVKFYNDTADDVAFKPDSFDPIKSDKYGRAINVKELPGIEKLIDAGSTASIGVEVAYSKEKKLITVETINPENKILRFKDADFRYQFYNDGRYTSNVSGDTSGSISRTGYVKFFSNWNQTVNFVPSALGYVEPYTYGSKTGVAQLPYYENMLGNPDADGLEVIYSHTEKTVTIKPFDAPTPDPDPTPGPAPDPTPDPTPDPEKPTDTYTVPVEAGAEATPVKAKIEEKIAVVDPIEDKVLKEVVAKGTEDTLTIDVSGADEKVNGTALDKQTAEKIVDILADTTNKIDSFKIKTPSANITLDEKALEAIAANAGTAKDIIKLVVEDTGKKMEGLTEKQKKAIESNELLATIDAYVLSGKNRVHDLKGGKMKVAVEYPFDDSYSVNNVKLIHMLNTGEAQIIDWTPYYDKGKKYAEFVTDSLSYFAFSYDKEANTEESVFNNSIAINNGFRVNQTKKQINVEWGRVEGATKYVVYAGYCGTKLKKVGTYTEALNCTIKKLDGKSINLTRNFKVMVKAYNGKTVAGKTILAHVVGSKNTVYTNAKDIELNTESISLKAGKTKKITGKSVLVDSTKKPLTNKHAKEFRFISSDESVASVKKNGTVTAQNAGTCTIYVYARNGYAKEVKVTVK